MKHWLRQDFGAYACLLTQTPYANMQVCGQILYEIMHARGQFPPFKLCMFMAKTFLIICMFVAKLPYDTMHVYGQSLYDVMHVEAKPFLASCMF